MRISRSTYLVVLVGLLTATASVGQAQSSDPTTSAGATASTVPTAQDAEFLTKAAQAGRDEVEGGKAGDDFDSKYLTEEIRHHTEAISLYRKQAASGVDPDLQKFATDSLPRLEHHLDMLESANGQ